MPEVHYLLVSSVFIFPTKLVDAMLFSTEVWVLKCWEFLERVVKMGLFLPSTINLKMTRLSKSCSPWQLAYLDQASSSESLNLCCMEGKKSVQNPMMFFEKTIDSVNTICSQEFKTENLQYGSWRCTYSLLHIIINSPCVSHAYYSTLQS